MGAQLPRRPEAAPPHLPHEPPPPCPAAPRPCPPPASPPRGLQPASSNSQSSWPAAASSSRGPSRFGTQGRPAAPLRSTRRPFTAAAAICSSLAAARRPGRLGEGSICARRPQKAGRHGGAAASSLRRPVSWPRFSCPAQLGRRGGTTCRCGLCGLRISFHLRESALRERPAHT